MIESTESIPVGYAFRISDELQAEIAGLDSRIRLVNLAPLGKPTPPDEATRAALLDAVASVEVLVGTHLIPNDYFDAAEKLRWFQVINAGVDDLQARGLVGRQFSITTGAGIAAVGIAEHSLALMLMLARGMHRLLVQQQDRHWEMQPSLQLAGKTLGVVGLGEIGRETARRARAFGMRVIACRRTVGSGADPDCDQLLPYDQLDSLLAQSDYVHLAVPLTPETRHLIGAPQFAQMKPTAFLINVARGEVVDQDALIAALQSGQIAGAGLDVVTPEPLPVDNPLWAMPNVILTPHTAGYIESYGHRAIEVFIANLRRYLANEALSHVVDPVLGY